MNLISDTRGRRQAFLISLSVTLVGILCKFNNYFSFIGWCIHNKSIFVDDFTIYERIRCWIYHAFVLHSMCWFPQWQTSTKGNRYFEQQWVFFLVKWSGIVSIVLGFFYLMKLNWLEFTLIFQLIPFLIVLLTFFFYLQ